MRYFSGMAINHLVEFGRYGSVLERLKLSKDTQVTVYFIDKSDDVCYKVTCKHPLSPLDEIECKEVSKKECK